MASNFTPNSARFLENYVNVSHSVLGVKLRPFCLLHLLWLEHLESPLFNTSEAVTLSDLEIAVLICSSNSSEEILSKVSRKRRPIWHFFNKRRRNLTKEIRSFISYQDDFASLPVFGDSAEGSEGETTSSQLPWILMQIAALIKATGWSEETVLTTPLGKVFWLNSAFGYLATGQTSVISDKEQLAAIAFEQLGLTAKG